MDELEGQVAIVVGGGGHLCSKIAMGLAAHGVRLAVLDIDPEKARATADQITRAGGEALSFEADVLDRVRLQQSARCLMRRFGRIDLLINGAGGNHPAATTSERQSFFSLPEDAFRMVLDVNFLGTVLASQTFGRHMANAGSGGIINISSIGVLRPLTRIPAYVAAKAAVESFTKWLAVYMSQHVSPAIRVNAIAPGFFPTPQNRYLLIDESNRPSERGRQVLKSTPMARFGAPSDLVGPVLWLASSASEFVHGIVLPVDGGFSAFAGV